ncbi:TPA: hypothetical protein N2G45_002887 [Salmonella enterica]|nr:hypothetical protein [Salmonella enterica]HCL5283982.1 hypothetical protein [Salmonella enterica]
MTDKKRWVLTHDSHELKKGQIYEGETLPAWLAGKAVLSTASAVPAEGVTQAQFDEVKALNDALTAEVAALKAQLTEMQAKTKKG